MRWIGSNMKEQFSDYAGKEKELLNRHVLYTYGSYGATARSIRRIALVTKTGFRLSSIANGLNEIDNTMLFSFSGQQKGLHGRQNMGTTSYCDLLTEDEVQELTDAWKLNKLLHHQLIQYRNLL